MSDGDKGKIYANIGDKKLSALLGDTLRSPVN